MRGRLSRQSRMPREAVPWHERDGGFRLAHDQELLSARYPRLAFSVDPETKRVSAQGTIDYKLCCDVPTSVAVRIEFPSAYPNQEPRAYDGENRFPHEADRHFHPDGECCLWLRPESEWESRNPCALAHFLDQVAVFFDRQLICEALPSYTAAQWPGGAREHGAAGYLEYVRDEFGDESLLRALLPALVGKDKIGRNKKCPCGNDVKYKHCHLRRVEEVRRSLNPVEVNRLLKLLERTSTSA